MPDPAHPPTAHEIPPASPLEPHTPRCHIRRRPSILSAPPRQNANRKIANRGNANMPAISTCLWFARDAEAATRQYVSIVPNSRIDHIQRSPADWPGGEAGDVILIRFHLGGQSFQALNGGNQADYGTAASISVLCADQAEIDRLWAALTADGGTQIMCGWLRDRWGVPWQIVPEILPRLLADPDPAVAARVFAAIVEMVKLDAAALQRAASG